MRSRLWQINCRRPHSLDRIRHTSHLVSWEIVDDDNVAAIECRDETSFDIGEEGRSVHRSVDHEGGNDPIMTQTRHQGDGLPVPVWNGPDQSFAAGTTTPQSHAGMCSNYERDAAPICSRPP